jgi:hypothetical protein
MQHEDLWLGQHDDPWFGRFQHENKTKQNKTNYLASQIDVYLWPY